MAQLKTRPTQRNVERFLASVGDERQREDCKALLGMMQQVTKQPPRMWGPSMIGFVSLSGIVVNDSILLVTFVKRHARRGMAIHDAARQASRDRFRAVFLTSLTTIVGLLPLLSETSLQAQVLIPLAASLAFGLLASTLLVLLVVPAFYTILEDFGLATTSSPKTTSIAAETT